MAEMWAPARIEGKSPCSQARLTALAPLMTCSCAPNTFKAVVLYSGVYIALAKLNLLLLTFFKINSLFLKKLTGGGPLGVAKPPV